ncbi:MAG: hypothetical protein ACW968_14070 [Candidatus Thorarchaeota archaeon]
MTSNFENQYRDGLTFLERELRTRMSDINSSSELSVILKPVFEAVVGIIHENLDALGDDADEFTETLCYETCFKILECVNLEHELLDLLQVSRYIAGESAVAYSMSGVVDVLDEEHQIKRIAAAFLGGLLYLLMLHVR